MKYLNIFVFLFLVSACSERHADTENPLKYDKNGLSFYYPTNWKVTEDSEADNVRFIFIESPGDAITIIEIYPLNESIELKEFVVLDIRAFNKEVATFLAQSDDGKVDKTKTSINGVDFGGYRYEFNLSVLDIDVPHVAEFYSLYSSNKIAYIKNQVATEDLLKVDSGFKQILASFKLKI